MMRVVKAANDLKPFGVVYILNFGSLQKSDLKRSRICKYSEGKPLSHRVAAVMCEKWGAGSILLDYPKTEHYQGTKRKFQIQ